MPSPTLNDSQIEGLIQQVAEYIESQRHHYRSRATPLGTNQKAVMAPFFPQAALESTEVVVLDCERVGNPGFYSDLVAMGFELALLPDFSMMAAITFVDTVVFHEPIMNRTLFHELVHVVQYDKLAFRISSLRKD